MNQVQNYSIITNKINNNPLINHFDSVFLTLLICNSLIIWLIIINEVSKSAQYY